MHGEDAQACGAGLEQQEDHGAMELFRPDADGERFSAMCKALGHPARLAILRRLKEIDRCVCGEIVQMLPLAQSTVSQHLRVLKQAGLVCGEVDGPRTCYCVDKEGVAFFHAWAMKEFSKPILGEKVKNI